VTQLHLLFDPKDRLGKGDAQIEAQIVTLPRPAATLLGGAATHTPTKATEKRFKQVGKAAHVAHVGHATTTAETGFAELVVPGPRLGIAQDLIGTADLLEAVLGARVLVDVWVVLARQAPVRPLEGVGIGIAADTQQLVVIGHQSACSWAGGSAASTALPGAGPGPMDTLTRAWRSTRPLSW